jgi:type IV pilus assembly protein PilO
MASPADQMMDRLTKLPTPQKVAILVAVGAALSGANYFFLIDGEFVEFANQAKKLRGLEEEVIQASAIANNLNQFRKEKELLNQELQKALTELPAEANIPELVHSMSELAQKAGLTINNLEPGVEKGGDQGLYNQIPMSMAVTGSFQEIGVFFDSVRQLKRIVNVSGIKMTNPRIKNDQVLVDANYTATSFRFVDQPKDEKKDKKDKGEKK